MLEPMDVLVTGGTGALGRQVVRQLRGAGHRAVVLSRRPAEGPDWRQGDLRTGAGIAEAVRGMEAIVHAGSATTQPWRYRSTDVGGTGRLLELARLAGVRHFVYVSIVGMEGVHYPYYRFKLAGERLVEEGRLPWSIQRATQFHTLVELYLDRVFALPGLLMVPFAWRFQPVDTRDVARRVVQVVTGEPGGRLPDYGGPEVRDMRSLAESWLRVRGLRRRLVNLRLPLRLTRELAAGRLLCPEHRDGVITWEAYLERRAERAGWLRAT